MSITCCKGCLDRYVGCHSKCDKYIEQKIKNDEVNNKRLEYIKSNAWTYHHRQAKLNSLKSKNKILHKGVVV